MTFRLGDFDLENLILDIPSLLIGLGLGLIPLVILLFWRSQARQTFSIAAQEALRQSNENFLQLAEQRLKQAQNEGNSDLDLRKREIAALVDPVNSALKNMDEKLRALEIARANAYTELRTHVQSMTEDQQRLRQETSSLVQALRSPSTRGQWGEMQLQRCLEMAGLREGIHYQTQVSSQTESGSQRPDVVVNLSDGKKIVIDSKAPIDAYLNAMKDENNGEDRRRHFDRHARHVRDHMKSLGLKSYQDKFDSPEFVVMFLPGESYFSAALERDPALIEFGVDQKVIPATPTTIISLLKAVMYGWRQEQLAENAKEISSLGRELYERISVFSGHMGAVGKSLTAATNNYNKAISSLENRVLVSARKFEELQAAPEQKNLDAPEPVDTATKILTTPEITETDEDTSEDKPANVANLKRSSKA